MDSKEKGVEQKFLNKDDLFIAIGQTLTCVMAIEAILESTGKLDIVREDGENDDNKPDDVELNMYKYMRDLLALLTGYIGDQEEELYQELKTYLLENYKIALEEIGKIAKYYN